MIYRSARYASWHAGLLLFAPLIEPMPRKISVLTAVLTLVLSTLAASPRPNIILVMADDMGYGDPSYVSQSVLAPDGSPHPDQGWIQTPNMDAMAAQGIRFDRFYSASAVCSPTRASCLTGRNPFRVGVPYANTGNLGADETPLSTILAAEGYATGHFGKWHLGTMTTLRNDSNRGRPGDSSHYSPPWHFDYDTCFASESKVPTYHPYRKTVNGAALPTAYTIDPDLGYVITDSNFYGTHYWKIPENPETAAEGLVARLDEVNSDPNGDPAVGDGDDSKLLTDQAIRFIQSAAAEDQPFFVVLWYHTPHKPLVDPDGISGVDSSDAAEDGIEDMDTAIGDLRTALTDLGVRENTMLWLTSDNGPENGVDSPNEISTSRSIRSGGLRARKRSFYEGGIRVPGILEWPDGITNPGRGTAFLSSTSDYYTTILDYLDLSVPGQKALDGISLRPVIDDLSETRTTPIGFRISNESIRETWIAQDYKLVKASEWVLYDMTLPDYQLEVSPLATESNLASQPQDIQDVFNAMLADYNAWEATVDSDTAYVSGAVPTTVLSTTASEVDEVFEISIDFSAAVDGLSPGDFVIDGGTAGAVSGSGSSYTVTILPDFVNDLTIQLPEAAAFAASGHPSAASNELTVVLADPLTIEIETSEIPFVSGNYATVDSNDLSPADGSNNVSKFSDPFATDLYVRSNSNEAARRVRALMQFDVSGLSPGDVDQAILHMHGYALNDLNSVGLQAIAAAADWSVSPSYGIATQGAAVNGGDVIGGIDADLARDYSLDVTEMAQAWVDGSWTNYGILLQLSNENANNGLGIQLTGAAAPRLEVNKIPLKLLRSRMLPQEGGDDLFSLTFQVVPGSDYYLLKNTSLDAAGWFNFEQRRADNNFMSFALPIDPGLEPRAFFNLSTEDPQAP